MAYAYFINASPVSIAVNLNSNLEKNYMLKTYVAGDLDENNETNIAFNCWAAEISAYPNTDVFGGDGQNNTLVVFRDGLSPITYTITSTESITLNLYFYITGETILGVNATGTTTGININVSVSKDLEAMDSRIPIPDFTSFNKESS